MGAFSMGLLTIIDESIRLLILFLQVPSACHYRALKPLKTPPRM
jgi:hypothetical protein